MNGTDAKTGTMIEAITSPMRDLARNLAGGLRLILPLPVESGAFAARTVQSILLLGLVLLIDAGRHAVPHWPVGGAYAHGLGTILLRYVALLAPLYALTWGFGSKHRAGEVQIMVLAGVAWAEVARLLAFNTFSWPELPIWFAPALWMAFTGLWAFVAMRALRAATGASWPLAALGGALTAGAVWLAGKNFGGYPVFYAAQ